MQFNSKKPMSNNKDFTDLQEKIIENWKQTKVVHPSYGSIAKELRCSVATVFRTVKKFQQLKK